MAAWYVGNYATTNTCTSSAYGNGVIYWPIWHDQTASSMITSTTSATTSATSNIIGWPVWHDNIATPAIIHSEVYHREQEARMRQAQEEAAARRQQAQDANAKAKELLVGHLTPEQRQMMDKLGWFVVRGGKSGRLYRIEARGIAGNVAELNDNKPVARYCCHLEHQYPAHDHHLAQKLMLEHDEETFLRLANKRAA